MPGSCKGFVSVLPYLLIFVMPVAFLVDDFLMTVVKNSCCLFSVLSLTEISSGFIR